MGHRHIGYFPCSIFVAFADAMWRRLKTQTLVCMFHSFTVLKIAMSIAITSHNITVTFRVCVTPRSAQPMHVTHVTLCTCVAALSLACVREPGWVFRASSSFRLLFFTTPTGSLLPLATLLRSTDGWMFSSVWFCCLRLPVTRT